MNTNNVNATNLQLELMRIFSFNLDKKQLSAYRKIISIIKV